DSQEVVYRSMLADLSKSVELLNTISYSVMAQYDLIYNGNVQNWVKLANSLMLRIAVRVHFIDETLAKEYITKALDPKNGGVIEDISSEAKIKSSDKMPLLNSMLASVNEYNETRMGATIWGYLDGYKDPRLSAYFTEGTYGSGSWAQTGYFPVAPTNSKSKSETSYSAKFASRPKVDSNSPLYWFRASETYFLKAEAALYNLIGGDPKTFYEQGINISFQEQGVSGVATYLSGTGKPTGLTGSNYKYGTYNHDLSIGNTSPKWDDYTGNLSKQEEQLQKIITQKYLALYPNAVEAWTEYRRTGFPYLMKPMDEAAPGRIGASIEDCRVPERFRFAPTAYNSNPNMAEIPTLLGGGDIGATKLWWVRSNRPKQPNQ
ncbi:SusD/RagB family nutrient-binding outer membrane lipoprotein, partial [Bacteroides thetaiotaomicron]